MDLGDLRFCLQALIIILVTYHPCLGLTPNDNAIPDENDPLIVKTNKGYIRGVTLQSAHSKSVDAFLGIPFAQPPVGKYRFRHPKPMDPWKGIRNATDKPNTCYQISDTFFGDFAGSDIWNPNTNLSEDCLKINVWVPRPRPKNAAVLLWIYGGGFYSGSSSIEVYDPKILVSEENIVFVSMNYRLASLGFLYLGIPDAPGNAGMYDQLMALHWVRDNIAKFGGNPLNVTLFGESAGAVSVTYHLLSPLSRDLFSQAIIQSGAAVSPWALFDKKNILERGRHLAEAMKCPSDLNDPQAIVDCLRTRDPFEMVSNEWDNLGIIEFPFGPIVDGSFIDELPSESMINRNFKKTNLMSGTNSEEGMYFIIYYLTDYFKKTDTLHLSREQFLASVKELNPYVGEMGQEAIVFEYTDWNDPNDTDKNKDAVDKIVGDYHFTCGVNQFSQHYAEAGNHVYKYFFKHISSVSPWPSWMGVLHADEIAFVFGEPLNPELGYNEDERKLSKRMMRYWANFARSGDPNINDKEGHETVAWPLHTAQKKEYLTLATNSNAVGYGIRSRQCAFWQDYLPRLVKATESSHNPRSDCKTSGAVSCVSRVDRTLSLMVFLIPLAANVWS